jgi:hypothetical protein
VCRRAARVNAVKNTSLAAQANKNDVTHRAAAVVVRVVSGAGAGAGSGEALCGGVGGAGAVNAARAGVKHGTRLATRSKGWRF